MNKHVARRPLIVALLIMILSVTAGGIFMARSGTGTLPSAAGVPQVSLASAKMPSTSLPTTGKDKDQGDPQPAASGPGAAVPATTSSYIPGTDKSAGQAPPATQKSPVVLPKPAHADAVILSTAAGGPWSSTSTWQGGVVPTATDDAVIINGATVTIDTAAVALDVQVGQGTSGVLTWDATTARTLTVGSNVVVSAGGQFVTDPAGIIATHVLSLGGNLTNNGTINFSQNADTSQASINFTGAGTTTFQNGAAATLNLKGSTTAAGITLNETSGSICREAP